MPLTFSTNRNSPISFLNFNPASFFSGVFRETLTQDRTYYVLKTGSDSNNGLTNSATGAFLTIGQAISAVSALDFGGNNITIQVGAGTYTEDLVIADNTGTFDGGVFLIGAGATTIIDGLIYVQVGSPWLWDFSLFKFQNSGGNDCFDVDGGWVSTGQNGGNTWGSCPGKSHIVVHNGGFAYGISDDTISGGGDSHWSAGSGGIIRHRGKTITLTGTPNFTNAFAAVDSWGDMQIDGNTFSGSATGKRFFIQAGGRLKTNTQDLTYLPGNTAGTFSGGFYEGIMGCAYPITTAPTTQTGAAYTVGATDSSIIANRAGTVTLTFPSAADYSGRWVYVKTIQNQTVVSASSNVVPLVGGAAGTAILAATAGKWAWLQSDGTNWVIMAGA